MFLRPNYLALYAGFFLIFFLFLTNGALISCIIIITDYLYLPCDVKQSASDVRKRLNLILLKSNFYLLKEKSLINFFGNYLYMVVAEVFEKFYKL